MHDLTYFENYNQLITNLKCRIKNNFEKFCFDFTIYENEKLQTTFETGTTVDQLIEFLTFAMSNYSCENGYAVFFNYKPAFEAPVVVIIHRDKYEKVKNKINELSYNILDEKLEPIVVISDVSESF